jgi:phosphoribosylaminoimidazolecarboxamide formyltransferase/IMP cyclohydrolase
MTKRAILSVHDKTGLIELGRGLAAQGWELVASGGTAHALRAAGLAARDVAELTGAPEMLGGRVKTLHPAIHGGILARDTADDAAELAAHAIAPIDLVVCNLYPFAATVARPNVTTAEAVEQIDIGGVTLLRAAAKNFGRVVVLCDPADYAPMLATLAAGGPAEGERRALAAKAFAHTQAYDAAVAEYLAPTPSPFGRGTGRGFWEGGDGTSNPRLEGESTELPQVLRLEWGQLQSLRYGENPHQTAALYAAPGVGPLGGRLVGGKALSYNNLLDLDAAWRAAESLAAPAVAIVKHLSPCGLAVADSVAAAFPAALASDPVSAFGGVIATNRPVDDAFVVALAAADLFVEAVIAPTFSATAAAWFAAHKKNCRLVEVGEAVGPALELRAVRGGLLAQTRDDGDPPGATWRVVGHRPPTDEEMAALRFAWLASQHVKSNAIVLARPTGAPVVVATVGIGGGLPSRVDAVRLAVAKAGTRARGSVLASDAFFPFADGLEAAAAAGVTAVVEPGGSVRDDDVVAAADRLGVALVFTGVRHFRH